MLCRVAERLLQWHEDTGLDLFNLVQASLACNITALISAFTALSEVHLGSSYGFHNTGWGLCKGVIRSNHHIQRCVSHSQLLLEIILESRHPRITCAPHSFTHGMALCHRQVAGGYGMAALYGVVPPLMAWRLRYGAPPIPGAARGSAGGGAGGGEWVPGGRAALVGLCAMAMAVEAGKLALDLHCL